LFENASSNNILVILTGHSHWSCGADCPDCRVHATAGYDGHLWHSNTNPTRGKSSHKLLIFKVL